MTGKKVAEALNRYTAMATGVGFATLLNKKFVRSGDGIDLIQQKIQKIVDQRLSVAKDLAEGLKSICRANGVLVVDSEYGEGVIADFTLSEDEERAVVALQNELEGVARFIDLNEHVD